MLPLHGSGLAPDGTGRRPPRFDVPSDTLADTLADDRVLDNPVLASLRGPHAAFARASGDALAYPADVSPFVALPGARPGAQPDGSPDAPPDTAARGAWADLARLVGPGAEVALTGPTTTPPAGWEVVWEGAGAQMVDVGVDAAPDPEAVVLGPADTAEVLDLVARTQPGPFRPRTLELGTYLGIRRDGGLVAMAGERLHPPGWTEISAVCTDPAHRGQGLAGRLVRAVAHGIRARGDRPLLHVAATNTGAIGLYERLGFEVRRDVWFAVVRTPSA